jgi:effector-binding domain-containing protein
MQILESIVAGVLVTLIIFLVYRLFRLRAFAKSLSELYMQGLADNFLLSKKVEELVQEIENKKLEDTDGFLKFVSDSRDWAFNYIEEVQMALLEFDNEISPQLEWATTYGALTGKTVHSGTIDKISEAYDKLKSILPENTETPNN